MKKITLFVLTSALLCGTMMFTNNAKNVEAAGESHTYFDKVITNETDLADWELYSMSVGTNDQGFTGIYPSKDTEYGTATYVINTSRGKVLDSLKFSVYGQENVARFAYYYGDAGVKAEVSISTNNVDFVVAATKYATASVVTSFDLDLTDYVSGQEYDSLFVKLYLGTTVEGCGYDTTWTTLSGLKITGSEITAGEEPTDHTYQVGDFFGGQGTHGTSTPMSYNATEVNGLCGDGNEVYGAIVGTTWGASIETIENQSGYVKYQIGKPNQIITGATLKGKFTFDAKGLDDSFNGDRIFISVSTDDNEYEVIAKYTHTVEKEAGWTKFDSTDPLEINLDLNQYLETHNRERYIYVKFEMIHLLALSKRELAYIGLCLHNSEVSYSTKNCLVVEYNTDGGQFVNPPQTAFLPTDGVYQLPELEREGYDFLGWYDADGEKVTSFNPSLGKSLKVVAHWKIHDGTYAITYIDTLKAENNNPTTFSENNPVTLVDLVKDGYNFLGWYDDAVGGQKVTVVSTELYQENITLFARWEENVYKVNYKYDENVELSVSEHVELPTEIKFSETLDITVTLKNNAVLKYIKVNGQFITLFESGFQISGREMKDINIEVATDLMKHRLNKSLDENFSKYSYGEHSYLEKVYASENARIIHDSDDNAGLSISNGENATLIYAFKADNKTHFEDIEISGSARLFDIARRDVKLEVFISSNDSDYKLLKQFIAKNPQSGDEYVDLSYSKLVDSYKDVFIKFVLTGSAGFDWAVIKSLGIELNQVEDKKFAPTTTTTETLTFDKYVPSNLTMNVDLHGEELIDVKVDNVAITSTDYSLLNTNIIINKQYLSTLSIGSHVVMLTTEGGSVSWSVNIVDTTPKPDPEPDPTPAKKGCGGSIVAVSGLITLLSLMGIAVISYKKEKK